MTLDLKKIRELTQASIDHGYALPDHHEIIVRLVEELEKLQGAPKEAKAEGGIMRVKAYDVLSRAVEEGVSYGYNRAHKHVEKPSPTAIVESVEREVMNSICEYFEFDL